MSRKEIPVNYQPSALLRTFLSTWRWWLSGGILSFILASILMSGWPDGLLPNLSYPFTYQGDGLSHSWMALRAIEGWIFENSRSGYPFGSNFLDYPGSDVGNLLLLKIIGAIFGGYYSAINIFFLLSFSVIFIASFCSLNAVGLSAALSFSAAILFSFLAFHFQRLGHLFYLWYFVVPIFFYFCFYFYFYPNSVSSISTIDIQKSICFLACFIILASFGVYYALFGVILLSVSAFAVFVKTGRFNSVLPSILAILIVISGVLINIGPNLVNKQIHGANLEVAVRTPDEAEIYGLKLMQLILPRADHREPRLASLTQQYNNSYPLINENITASLGIVGAVGLVLLFFCLLATSSGGNVDSRLSLLAMMVLVLFLFGTIGGLGALFSATISSSIRGWNRISVFIAFGSIAAFFMALQILIQHCFSEKRAKTVMIACALVIGGVGLYDQTVPGCLPCNVQTKAAFETDQNFVGEIERSLPKGSAIYQLPYMPFPEVAPLHRLHTYDLSVGFLHSKDLHWSYGGMKGRVGDLFYRALAQEPIEKQLEVIKHMGFSGIYIDRRGFTDNADLLINRLTAILGSGPTLQRADGQGVFFRLSAFLDTNLSSLSNFDIMKRSGYVVDELGARHTADFSEGIDFARRTWPDFLRNVKGLSGSEPWGRWSDANLNPSVKLTFFSPLPSRFTLVLSAQPFGRDGVQVLVVRVGDQVSRVTLQGGASEIRLPIVLTNNHVDTIEFVPQNPISPMELGLSEDTRKIGIGLFRLRFEE